MIGTESSLFPPPTLEEEIARLVGLHGKDAVVEAVKGATRPPRGRRAEGLDWKRLREWLEPDTADWLAGRDPFALRTNKAIAREFARKYPGHSADSTMRRIQRKLSAMRRWRLFAHAQHHTRDVYPYTVHLKAMEELAQTDERWRPMWETRQAVLERYRELFGEPEEQMTWSELETKPYSNALSHFAPKRSAGLLGMFANKAEG